MKGKNFTLYTPDFENPHSIAYLKDEDGNDWYAYQSVFNDSTLKIAYDNQGVICSMSREVSSLFPNGLSVAEIREEDIPVDLSINGDWVYLYGQIAPRELSKNELITRAAAIKSKLLLNAAATIAPLQDTVDVDEPTEMELNWLKAWKKYRVALNRVDTDAAPDIEWPEIPLKSMLF